MKKLFKTSAFEYDVIVLAANESFFAKFQVPEGIERFAKVERTRHSIKITPYWDVILVVQDLHDSGYGCKHIRFIRKDRSSEGATGLRNELPGAQPRLRTALQRAKATREHAPGDLMHAVVAYDDETVVPDYNVSGAYGWVIKKSEVQTYLRRVGHRRKSASR